MDLCLDSFIEILGDFRNNYSQLQLSKQEGQKFISGFVDSKGNLEKIKDYIHKNNLNVECKVSLFSDNIPFEKRYGQVVVPVCDMRKEAKFKSERAHQLVFGEWLCVLKHIDDYFLVKELRNGYVGYVHSNNFESCSFDVMERIKKFKIFIVEERFSYLKMQKKPFYPESDLGWLPVGSKLYVEDMNENILKVISPKNEYYISKKDTIEYSQRDFNVLEEYLSKYLRVPYVWGGCSTYGIDCSGLTGRIYDILGYNIPRDADQQEKFLDTIQIDNIQKGDLVFFPGHVGIYFEDGFICHSNITLGGVTWSNILNPRDAYEEKLNQTISSVGRLNR